VTGSRTPETHDWSARDYAFVPRDGGMNGTATFWEDQRNLPHVGDYLILRNGDRTSRYEITGEPTGAGDCTMHTFHLRFAPREAP
jgi:hypothetical protein